MRRQAVQEALEWTISHLDYDLHKALLEDEETGENTYPEVVTLFLTKYDEEIARLDREDPLRLADFIPLRQRNGIAGNT